MIERIDLSSAEAVFAVSNTPLFLLKKLSVDEAVRRVETDCPREEILDTIKAAASRKPESLRQVVLPYVCLVALSMKRDLEAMKIAAAFSAPYHDWYSYIAGVLIARFRPTQLLGVSVNPPVSLSIPGEITMPRVTTASASASNKLVITG